jgi:hypothetical protein
MKNSINIVLISVLIISCISINAAIVYRIIRTTDNIKQEQNQVQTLKSKITTKKTHKILNKNTHPNPSSKL